MHNINNKIMHRAVFITSLILLFSMSFISAPAYAASKGASPVAHWRFDEGGGAAAYDDSSNNNDLAFYHEVSWKAGKYGKALQFDGVDDVVTCDSSSGGVLNPASAITVGAWVYINGTKSSNYIVTKGWGDAWELSLDANNKLNFRIVNIPGSAQQVVVSNTALQNGKWYYVAGTYDQQNIKVYINGAFDNSQSYTSSIAQNSHKVAVGGIHHMETAYPNNGFNGKIDDVKIYNYARTADQIMVDYNAGSATYLGAGSDPNEGNPPVAYWKLDENTGTTAYDRSGNGNNGTLTNSPTWAQGKYGACLKFVTDSEHVVIPASSTINFGTSDFSVAAWVNINQPQTYGSGILGRYPHDTGYNGNFVVGILDDTTSLFFFHRNTSGAAESYGYDYRPYFGRWVYMAWVKSGTKLYLYLNGELKQSWTPSISFDVTFTGRDYQISDTGWSPGTMSNLMVDEHRLYNYARSAAQIAYDYNKGKPIAHYKFDEGGGVIAHNEASSSDTGTAPVGWWRFDEGSGTSSADSSGNGNTATLATAPAAPTWSASSKIGPYTLSFDGGDSVSVPQLLSGNSAFTAEAWVNPGDTTTAWKTVFAEGCNGFDLAINNAVINFGRNCGGGNGFYTGPTVSADTWYHLALVFDGTNLNLYTNGVKTTGGPSVYAHAPLYIGSYNGSGELFVGKIDDVRIYNYARTQEQVYNDYKTTHGTLVADAKFADGKIGKALQFDGTGDKVEIPYTTALDCTSGVTTEAWIKTASTGSNEVIFSKYGASGSGLSYMLILSGDGQAPNKISFYNIGWHHGSRVINDNKWHHIAATSDGATAKIYVDGALDLSEGTSSINTSTSTASIGGPNSNGWGANFNGLIDDVRVYNYARSAEQVLQDYNAGNAARLGAQGSGVSDPWGGALPTAHWKLDENTGVLAKDASGNGNNGTVSGAAWVQGKKGTGLRFDGSDDYLLLASTINLDDTADWTVSAWAKTSSGGSVLSNSSGGPVTSDLRIDASKICYGHYDGAWQYKYGTSNIANNNWHFLTWVNHSNQTIDLYVDGIREAAGVASVLTNDGPVNQIGRNWTTTANASIDDVRVYNYAMTQAQVTYAYNAGKPVSYWRMDEATSGSAVGTNNIKDSSGNGYHGSGAGTNIAWTTGKYGGALSFNGTDDYASVTQTLSTPITASCWVKLTDFSKTANTFINSNPHTVLAISLNRTGIGDIYVYIGNGTSWVGEPGIISSSNMVVNKWHHISYTCNGTISTLYLDGVSVGSANIAPSGWGSYFNLGRVVQSGEYLKGYMDDARIYNYARTAEQVMQDYNQGLSARTGD